MLKHSQKTTTSTFEGTTGEEQKKRLDAVTLKGQQDSLESQSRLIDSMKSTGEMAQWWDVYQMPTEATLEASYEESRKKAFGGDTSLMDSHKSKRKKSYMEKAKVQTQASQYVKAALGQRKTAKDSFLDSADDITVNEEDVAFLEDWCTIISPGQYDDLKAIFSGDEIQKKAAARNLLARVSITSVNLKKFEFDDDKEFLANFAGMYPQLCALSSADKLLDVLDEGIVSKEMAELKVMIETFKDIREAYENRMQILQSPYYALLLESDLKEGDKNYEALKSKMQSNPGAKAYFEAVEKRGKLKFGKEVKTAELYKKNLSESEEYKQMREHGGLMGDSDNNLTTMLKKSIPSDPDELIGQVNEIIELYRTMTENLDQRIKDLLAKEKPSKKEQAELDMLKEQSLRYSDEQRIFEIAAAQIKVDKLTPVPGVWENVLYNIRAERIDRDDSNVEVLGAGASEVFKVKRGDEVTYIKREERLIPDVSDAGLFRDALVHGNPIIAQMVGRINGFVQDRKLPASTSKEIKSALASILTTMLQKPMEKLPDDADEATRTAARKKFSDEMINALKLMGDLPGAEEFWKEFVLSDERNFEAMVALVDHGIHKYNEHETAIDSAGMDEGSFMSNRNVSTSIMADRLKVSDIVAKSHTVLLDNGDGTYMKGNAMEQVVGKEFGKFAKAALAEGAGVEYTPEVMGQLFTLQAFDMVCGQVDRHAGNFMVTEYEKQSVTVGDKTKTVYVVKAIKAIDNDMSFGMISGETVISGKHGEMVGFSLQNVERGLVKFLPETFVNQLHIYRHLPTLMADFGDTRSEKEINALYQRILSVSAEIDRRIASDDKPDQKIWVYSDPKQLNDIFRELQTNGVLARMKEEMSTIMAKGAYIDWDFVRTEPAEASEVRKKLGDEAGPVVTEEIEEAQYLASGDIIINSDITEVEEEKAQPKEKVREYRVFEQSHRDLEAKKEELLMSKVTHMFVHYSDSKEMTRVKNAIRALDDRFKQPVVKGEGFTASKKLLLDAYKEVIASTSAYLERIDEHQFKGRSQAAQRRYDLTQDIMKESQREYDVFFNLSEEGLRIQEMVDGSTWTDVLYNIRAQSVSLNNPDVTQIGAGASTLYRISTDGGSSYVKEDDPVMKNVKAGSAIKRYVLRTRAGGEEISDDLNAIMDDKKLSGLLCDAVAEMENTCSQENALTISREIGMSDEQYRNALSAAKKKFIRDTVLSAIDSFGEIKDYVREHLDEFIGMSRYFYRKSNEEFNGINCGEIEAGRPIACRNAATSRMAKRLKVFEMVAESHTVLLEKKDHTFVYANAMEGVESTATQKVMTLSDLLDYGKHNGLTCTYSPEFFKQFLSVHMLDLVCGQVDRHAGNYQVYYEQTESGEIIMKSLKAIDNDLAFGNIQGLTLRGMKNVALFDGKQVNIPYIDKDLFESICSYDSEKIALDFADILSPAEIQALQSRVKAYADQLVFLKATRQIKVLETPEQWEEAKREYDRKWQSGEINDGALYRHMVLERPNEAA